MSQTKDEHSINQQVQEEEDLREILKIRREVFLQEEGNNHMKDQISSHPLPHIY